MLAELNIIFLRLTILKAVFSRIKYSIHHLRVTQFINIFNKSKYVNIIILKWPILMHISTCFTNIKSATLTSYFHFAGVTGRTCLYIERCPWNQLSTEFHGNTIAPDIFRGVGHGECTVPIVYYLWAHEVSCWVLCY